MNEDEKNEIKDPRETGTRGLSGLPSLNTRERPDNIHFGRSAKEYRTFQKYKDLTTSPVQYIGDLYPEAGKSKYDTGVHTLSDLENINELRAQEQPWYDQIGNGALKMVTTASTTFIDGTLGTLMGLGTGIYNLMDDDPTTGFWRGMWDNAVTNAMADVNDKMEEVAKNYRSEWENNASVFERMLSAKGAANFWGDDILKNAGFTIGAAASIWATGGMGSLLNGSKAIGTIGKGLGLLSKGAQGLEYTKAGKVASWLAKTFVSTQGEASIEALNSTRESLKALDAETAAMNEEGHKQALLEYETAIANGVNPEIAKRAYENELMTLDNQIKEYGNHVQDTLGDAGNMIYAANIAALSVSNNLTLGSMIRGGFNNSKSLLNQAIKTSGGKTITTAEEAGKALLKGDLKFAAPKVDNATAKAIGHWALTSTQEGLEEGVQNIASNTGQIYAAAEGHKWAKDHTTMLDNLIDSDADADLATYSKAMGKAFEEQFGKLNSPGWTEVMAGFLTGALGVASVHTNKQGQIRPTWQGGIKESLEYVKGDNKAIAEIADKVNQALTSNKFNERAKHAVEQIAIKKEQDKALENDDINAYKNLEIQQLMSDAIFFRDMGMLDDYLAMYEEMAKGLSDEDLAELKAAAKGEDGEKSALELKPDEEIKKLYQDKAKSTLEKINQALKDFDQVDKQFGDKFSDETRREAVMELSYLNSLYWDTTRRLAEVNDEVEELENKDKRTPLEDILLKQKKAASEELQEQAKKLQKTANEYKNSPQKLQSKVEAKQLARQKKELYKQAEEAIKKYKVSNTLQDMVDVYVHSPEDTRDKVLDQAISQTEGETKTKLQQLRNYMGDVESLEHLIKDKFLSDEDKANPYKAAIFSNILENVVNEMLTDESPVLTRESLKDKLKDVAKKTEAEILEASSKAQGVTINDNGTFDFKAASDEGIVTDDDFEEILDDVDTGESHTEIKRGSKAEELSRAATLVKELQSFLEDTNYFIDSLDKIDDLKKAGKSKEESKVTRRKGEKEIKGSKVKVSEEVIEDEGTVEDEGSEGEEEGGFDDEEEAPVVTPPKKPAPRKSLLTPEEDRYYRVKEKKKDSGVTYNALERKADSPKKVKDAIAKKFNETITSLLGNKVAFENAKSEKDRYEIMKDILNIIQNNIIDNNTINSIEAFLNKNKKYLKPDSGKEGSLPPHSNEGQQSLVDSDTSMNGTQHPAYVSSELSKNEKMVAVTYQKSGKEPVQVWLEKQGFNIQEIIDNFLNKIIERDSKKSVKDKTPLYYLHTKEQPDAVFLGIEYSKVEDIIPRDKAKKVIKAQDGKTYLLVGEFGWEAARPGTKDMYETILDSFESNEYTDEGWTVNTENTNRIKDIEPGNRVKQTLDDTKVTLRELRELLEPDRNPRGLTIKDLSWTIIEGTKEAPTRKVINGSPSEIYGISKGMPGQVYLNIPASNGKFIPVYMETLNLSELEGGTPLFEEIYKFVSIIADRNTTMEDKKAAIGNLNDLLIFAPRINQLHVNDENSKVLPNTVAITKKGESSVLIDFSTGVGADARQLMNEVISLNPRINISTTVLDTNPEIYVESGVLITDIALLGTVNSRFFVYPVDDNGDYVENKPFKGTEKIYGSSPIRNRIYVNGKYVYYDGTKFTDIEGNTIDESQSFILESALKIKNGKIAPTKLGKVDYYVIDDDTVFVDNGHGGLDAVGEELAKKVINVKNKKKDKDNKKDNAKKEAKRIKKKDEIIVEDTRIEGVAPEAEEGDDFDNLDKEEPKDQTKKPTSFTNGTNVDEVASQEELDAQANSSSFEVVLSDRSNRAKTRELFGLIESKLGVKVNNIAAAVKELSKPEYQIDLSSNNIDTVINQLHCYKKG